MPIGIQRCGDRRVPEPGLDSLHVDAGGHQQPDVGVPQVVEPHLEQTSEEQVPLIGSVHVVWIHPGPGA